MSHSLEKKKSKILLSTKRVWLPLDEQQTPPPREEKLDSPIPEIENSRQENIQQWLDSGFFITAHENLQQAVIQTDSLNKQGVVPEAVNDYMRSLQQFSETPALSRGTSFNSSPSVPSIPKSISEWLEFWQKDPVEILLDLGFGAEEPDISTKIPARFLRSSSAARGINIRVFLEAHKHRMDLETPNLYGRFRQLEVLDHVTTAFSSLLNNVNNLQREGREKGQPEDPKLAQMNAIQDRRRRIGQLLRRASKQTIRKDCPRPRTESRRVKEDRCPAPGEPDKCPSLQATGMNLAAHSHLCPLTEKRPPLANAKQIANGASPSAPAKPWPPLLSVALKQHPLPSASEGSTRDRGFQEKALILSHRLRQLAHVDGKPPDSFEMEEVQSFEEEHGNPLEATLGAVGAGVTRASSCQSDSSGFLEEPPEPLPPQIPPLLANQSLCCGRQETWSPSLEFPQHQPQEPIADASQCTPSLPILDRDQSNLEEEISACVAEDDSLSADHLIHEGSFKETPTGKDQERKDNPTWNFPSGHQTNFEVDGGTITSKYDYSVGFTVAHIVEVKPDRPEVEEPEAVFMGRSINIMGNRYDQGAPIHVDKYKSSSEVPRDGRAGQQDADISRVGSSPENGILTTPRQDFPTQSEVTPSLGDLDEVSKLSIYSSDDVDGCRLLSPSGLSVSGKTSPKSDTKVGNFILDAEPNTNGLRSVTIQMPSKLVSGIHSTTSGEGPRESTLDPPFKPSKFYKSETFLTSTPGKGVRERQTKEASVQTEKNKLGFQNMRPALNCCCPATRRRHHLTQSVSLDSGSLGIHWSTSDSKPAVHRIPCKHENCCCCCCCCCWHRHHAWDWQQHDCASCSYQHHLQNQLTKIVKVLQEAVLREFSPSTVQDMEIWRAVCQSFREHSEEIGHHLLKQQAYVLSDMSEEGREEMRQLHNLRQDLHQQVTELEFQLSDRARQIQEGMLLFDQLLEEQSLLCSELDLSNWGEGSKSTCHADSDIQETVLPRAASPPIKGQGTSLPEQTRALTSPSSGGSPEIALPSPTLADPSLTPSATSWDQHGSHEVKMGSTQSRIDLKGFLCKLKKTFKSSFGNEPADGQN